MKKKITREEKRRRTKWACEIDHFCGDMRKERERERERECCRVLPIDDRTKRYNLRMWTIQAINVGWSESKKERKKEKTNKREHELDEVLFSLPLCNLLTLSNLFPVVRFLRRARRQQNEK